MSTYRIDLYELYVNEFHINPNTAIIAVADKLLNDFKDIEVIDFEKPLHALSKQGVPVWDYILIAPKIIAGTGEKYEGYSFATECIVTAVLPKKIAQTDVFGMDGTVEELMGNEDWDLTIQGFIINYESKDYPEEEVRALKRLCTLKETEFEVESTFMNMLDINYISIHELALEPTAGYSNMQKFEIRAKSKIPYIIYPTDGVLL